MHERATLGAGLQITYQRQFDRLVELSRAGASATAARRPRIR